MVKRIRNSLSIKVFLWIAGLLVLCSVLIYGIVIGLLTFLIRNFGSMNEGMSYAILMGNLLTPWFNEWGHQIPLGRVKPKKKAENQAAAASAGKGGAA